MRSLTSSTSATIHLTFPSPARVSRSAAGDESAKLVHRRLANVGRDDAARLLVLAPPFEFNRMLQFGEPGRGRILDPREALADDRIGLAAASPSASIYDDPRYGRIVGFEKAVEASDEVAALAGFRILQGRQQSGEMAVKRKRLLDLSLRALRRLQAGERSEDQGKQSGKAGKGAPFSYEIAPVVAMATEPAVAPTTRQRTAAAVERAKPERTFSTALTTGENAQAMIS